MKVYLACPAGNDEWRTDATRRLVAHGVTVLDPILGRDFRGIEDGREQEIVRGDLTDIVAADAVLGNYTEPGWGTAMESWFAHSIGRRVVAYVEPGDRVSPWVAYISHANVYTRLGRAVSAAVFP
jgi:nucleoside 2-deoxyribosyltransferase